MKNIEQEVSTIVKTHFPDFYEAEGPRFIDFVQQYYAWLEAEGGALNASRHLFNYRDIDKTSNTFIKYFKNKYLTGYPLDKKSNTQFFAKHSADIYNTKGTSNGVEVTLRGIFNQPAEVYYPSRDLFKSSDGTWVRPVYLEISGSDRNASFLGKEIIGNRSKAKAFCESIISKRINGKIVNVAYLSNVRGNFTTGEYITTSADQSLANAPKMLGSLSSLTVLNGGQLFAVGDVFTLSSENGGFGTARVSSVSTETGRVNFIFESPFRDGGWGYSIAHSNVMVAQKMLQVANITNTNTSITNFQNFETVSQNFSNITFTNARPNNSIFTPGDVLENFYAGGALAANAVVVSSGIANTTHGYVIVVDKTGNVGGVDSVFSVRNGTLTSTFNSLSGVNGTTEYITTASAHGFVNNDIVVYSVRAGNTSLTALSTGAAYFVVGANSTALQLSDTANGTPIDLATGLNESGHVLRKAKGSAVWVSDVDRTSNGFVIGTNSSYVGVTSVTNPFIITPYSKIVGSLSNTRATVANVSTGTGATFKIGLLTNEEQVLLSPEALTGYNTQNVVFSTLNLNGNNSGAALQYPLGSPQYLDSGDRKYGGWGFSKYPYAGMDSRLYDTLLFEQVSIGTIASLTGINSGSDYNVDPFVMVVDPYTYGYDRRDYIVEVSNQTGNFVVGEQVQQTTTGVATVLTVNTFSGTAANGTSMSTVIVGESIYQLYANGAQRANGFVSEAGLSAGAGTIKLITVSGTFVNTTNTSTYMRSLSSNGTANISFVDTVAYTTRAKAYVQAIDSDTLYLKRVNFYDTFTVDGLILGQTSGATANIVSLARDTTRPAVGGNANVTSNVQTAVGSVKTLEVYDSGFGYIDQEVVTLVKEGSDFTVTAITDVAKQGIGSGFFSSTRGFLDSDKKLHDNDYYQEYSYEVITKIPFAKYINVLKQVAHVAGTKAFGKVSSVSVVNTEMTVINSITVS